MHIQVSSAVVDQHPQAWRVAGIMFFGLHDFVFRIFVFHFYFLHSGGVLNKYGRPQINYGGPNRNIVWGRKTFRFLVS